MAEALAGDTKSDWLSRLQRYDVPAVRPLLLRSVFGHHIGSTFAGFMPVAMCAEIIPVRTVLAYMWR